MRSRGILGVASFVLSVVLMIPLLFWISRGAVSPNQFALIVGGVLALVLWTISYATLIDPGLRRMAGTLLGVTIEWQGTTNSLSWTPVENTGCLVGLLIPLLGYGCIVLWLVPFAAAIGLVLWFRR